MTPEETERALDSLREAVFGFQAHGEYRPGVRQRIDSIEQHFEDMEKEVGNISEEIRKLSRMVMIGMVIILAILLTYRWDLKNIAEFLRVVFPP